MQPEQKRSRPNGQRLLWVVSRLWILTLYVLGCAPNDAGHADEPSISGQAALALHAVTPNVFPTTGGALLRLHGAGFTADMHVEIDERPISPVTVRTSELLEVRLPPRTGVFGPATITIGRGAKDRMTRSDLFRYTASTIRFGDAAAYELGEEILAVLSADFDGDGRLDLAALTRLTGELSILLQQPAGDFLPRATIAGDLSPHGLAAADLDRDGAQDLILVSLGGLAILRGHGDGTFDSPRRTEYRNGLCVSVLVADLDEDGALDIAMACAGYAAVKLLWGDGKGQFTPGEVAGPERPCAVRSADFDRDGHPDLVLGSCQEGKQRITFLFRDANERRRFHRKDLYLPDDVVELDALAVADLDLDEVPDLVLSDWGTWFRQRFVHTVLLKRDGSVKRLQTFEINADQAPSWMGLPVFRYGSPGGAPDVLVGGGKTLYVLKNQDGVFTLTEPRIADTGCRIVVELDRDGAPDLVACDDSVLQVIWGKKVDPSSHPADVPVAGSEFDVTKSLSADLDQDGTSDLIYAQHAGHWEYGGKKINFILSGRSNLAFRENYIETKDRIIDFAIADMNNDSKPDIVISNVSEDKEKTISILINKTLPGKAVSFDEKGAAQSAPIGGAQMVVTRLDGDPHPDVVLVGRDGRFCVGHGGVRAGTGEVVLAWNDCFSSRLSMPSGLAVADLDGDRRPDLIVTTEREGVFVSWGLADSKFLEPIAILNAENASTGINDIDRDGYPDLIINTMDFVYGLRNLGNRKWTIPDYIAKLDKPYQSLRKQVVVFDSNGDGYDDVVLRQIRARHMTLLLNSGFGKSWQAVPITTSADPLNELVAGDVDADGRSDLFGLTFGPAPAIGHAVYFMNRSQ